MNTKAIYIKLSEVDKNTLTKLQGRIQVLETKQPFHTIIAHLINLANEDTVIFNNLISKFK